MDKVNVFKGLLNIYDFISVVTCTMVFQIIIVEFLGYFANTYPLSLFQWFLCVAVGFLGMPIAAAVKFVPV